MLLLSLLLKSTIVNTTARAFSDCYSDKERDFCAKEEYNLRLCLSLMSCYKHAKVLYDRDQPRSRRVKANKGLQQCLRQNHLKELECKRDLSPI